MAVLSVLFLAATLPAPARGQAVTLRVVVASYKQSLSHAESYAAYRAHMEDLLQRAAAHFQPGGPNLVILPEASSLVTWLTGPRGAVSRLLPPFPQSSSAALALLAASYAPQVADYAARCPGIPPARALFLALTDTVWRAVGETFATLAARHRAWILVGAYVGDVSVVRDPSRVALLADPLSVARGYAYQAGCDVWNAALLFRPDARLDSDGAADPARVLGGVQRKAYLVPIERAQDVGLALSSESPENVHPLRIPLAEGAVARLGVVTSKDAWMADLPERLDIEGAQLLVQPEAGGWAGVNEGGTDDPWPQDALHRSAPAQTARLPSVLMGAISTLHGNFFDLYFDGTPTITGDCAGAALHWLLGMEPDCAIVARAPWVASDDDPSVPLPERRRRLAEAGRRLLPGSGDPAEGGQIEPIVSADLAVPRREPAPRVGRAGAASVPIAGGGSVPISGGAMVPISGGGSVPIAGGGAQWQPRLAAAPDGGLVAAYVGFDPSPFVGLARSDDGGRSWVPSARLAADPRPYDQQDMRYDPDVAVGPDGVVHVVWSDFRNQSWDLRHHPGDVRVDASPSSGEGFPAENFEQDPDLAVLPSGRLLVAFDSARGKRPDRDIRLARSDDGGARWTEVRVDPEPEPPPPGRGADAWHPALAVAPDGTVLLAWQTEGRILAARSTDGGETFGPPLVAGEGFLPAVAAAPDGSFHLAWERLAADGGREVVYAPLGGAPQAVDPGRPPGTVQTRAAVAVGPDGTVHVAWTDDRAGDQDVLVASPGSPPVRVDDGPDGSDARLPSILQTASGLVVAWEDARGPSPQARAAVVS